MFLRANCNFVTVYTIKGIQTDWVLNDLTDINKIELMQRQCLVVFICFQLMVPKNGVRLHFSMGKMYFIVKA